MEFENEESDTHRTKGQVCQQMEPHIGLEMGAEVPWDCSVGNPG